MIHGDLISVGNGVPRDEVRFYVTVPQSVRQVQTSGFHAIYDLGETIGKGAFATVKKAIERTTGNMFATKIIEKNKFSKGSAIAREIEILKQLHHEFIVSLIGFYEDERYFYLVMDYVGGGDLMEFVMDNGEVPEDAAQVIVSQILEAVNYVHGLGISHRDLKPDNILIAQDNPVRIKVSDFGLAKISQAGTFLKTFCGTLAYLAPEVMSGSNSGRYSNLVDMWSVGCLTYVILTGYLPFNGNTQEELAKRVRAGKFDRQILINKQVSLEGVQFIEAMLQVDPSRRPNTEQALRMPWMRKQFVELEENNEDESPDEKALAGMHIDSSYNTRQQRNGKAQSVGTTGPAPAGVPDLGDTPTPFEAKIYDSDSDSPEVREAVQEECSQLVVNDTRERYNNEKMWSSSPDNNNDYNNRMNIDDDNNMIPFPLSIRDLEDDQRLEYSPGTWLKLATIPGSVPSRDQYLANDLVFIGRKYANSTNDIEIQESRVSKIHCCISKNRTKSGLEEVWFTDLSTNGCIVNSVQIGKGKRVLLQDGDRLCLFTDYTDGKFAVLAYDVQFLNHVGYVKRASSTRIVPEIATNVRELLKGRESLGAGVTETPHLRKRTYNPYGTEETLRPNKRNSLYQKHKRR